MKVIRVQSEVGKKLAVALKTLGDRKVGKVGWFEDSKYPEKPHAPVAYVATIQEYGYPAGNIPARPFMRPTIRDKQTQWRLIAEQGAKAILKGSAKPGDVLEAIGLRAAGDIRKTISLITAPPLKESTIRARLAKRANKKTVGSLTKPLIDTGLMYGTLTSKVEDE